MTKEEIDKKRVVNIIKLFGAENCQGHNNLESYSFWRRGKTRDKMCGKGHGMYLYGNGSNNQYLNLLWMRTFSPLSVSCEIS